MEQRHFESSEKLCEYLAARSDTVILSFSLGKDALASWLFLREYFPHIIPYYLYLVPDLSFVQRGIDYFENHFQTRIIQLPHPSLYRMLNNMIFQAPENCRIIEEMALPKFGYDDISGWIKRDYKIPEDVYTAHGVRAADSIMRRTSIKRWGSLNEIRKSFFPIFDWPKARLMDTIKASGVRLPVDYRMFGRSFDGIDYRFLKPIHDHYPEDYKKILEWFPLADLEIRRREWRVKYHAG